VIVGFQTPSPIRARARRPTAAGVEIRYYDVI